VAEDERVEQREDLVDSCEQEREEDKGQVIAQVTGEDGHVILVGCFRGR